MPSPQLPPAAVLLFCFGVAVLLLFERLRNAAAVFATCPTEEMRANRLSGRRVAEEVRGGRVFNRPLILRAACDGRGVTDARARGPRRESV